MNRFSCTCAPQKGVCASIEACASIGTYTVGKSPGTDGLSSEHYNIITKGYIYMATKHSFISPVYYFR